MVQARNTDRRWSKSLQHEHSLRVQLQENIVTMANDLYGLENQAKNSVRKGKGAATPSVPTSGDTRLESGDYLLSHHPAEEPKLSQEEAAVSSDDEDGRFFDAPEISLEEWEKTVEASSEGSPTGGRSKEGMQRSTSLNEVSTQPVSPSDGTKQLPITSDRRMTVSLSTCTQKYLQWSLYNYYSGHFGANYFVLNREVSTLQRFQKYRNSPTICPPFLSSSSSFKRRVGVYPGTCANTPFIVQFVQLQVQRESHIFIALKAGCIPRSQSQNSLIFLTLRHWYSGKICWSLPQGKLL